MMRKRTGRDGTDSFELKLDTICNVFGGIILMSILVVLSTQAGVAQMPEEEIAAQKEAFEARKVQFEVERVQEELSVLQARRTALGENYAARVSPDMDKLLVRRSRFVGGVKEAERRLREVQKDQENARRQQQEAKGVRSSTEEDLESKRAELAELTKQLALQERTSRKKIRLPLRHDSNAPIQVGYIIEGNRIYVMGSEECTIRDLGEGGRHWTPRAGAGHVISAKGDSREFLALLSSISPVTHYLSIFVSATSESYESFQIARALSLARRFECGYGSYDPKVGLTTHPVSMGVQ